jgi:hypothetical protein
VVFEHRAKRVVWYLQLKQAEHERFGYETSHYHRIRVCCRPYERVRRISNAVWTGRLHRNTGRSGMRSLLRWILWSLSR